MASVRVKKDGPGWRVWIDGKKSSWPRMADKHAATALAREIRARERKCWQESRQ